MRDFIQCCLSKVLFSFLFLAGVNSGYAQDCSVAATYTISNVTCVGPNTGSINVSGKDGVAPYDYRLNNTGPYQTSGNFPELPAGTYQVSVRSADSCKKDTT